ncbi:hypothetical protein BVX97_04090 [bacterium E08(2017)]|nr:hypothetical protein BVX97_04090 [bacterium E08(2017)]
MTPTPTDFNYADLVSLIVIAIGIFVGYRRKLSGEIAILISVAAALFVGFFFFEPLGVWLATNTDLGINGARIATYVFIILGSSVVMVVLRLVLGKVLKIVIGEEADKIGGAIAGFVRSSIFVLIIFLLMNIIPNENLNRVFGEGSFIGRQTLKILPSIEEVIEEQMDGESTVDV